MKNLDDLLKYVPLCSGLIILFSYIKTSVYYAGFNINVNSYFELSEFIVIFINDWYFIAIFFIYYFIFSLLKKLLSYLKRNILYMLITGILSLVGIFFIVLRTVNNFKAENPSYGLSEVLMSVLFVSLCFTCFFIIGNTRFTKNFQLITSFAFTFLFIISFAVYRVYKTKNIESDLSYVLKLNNQTIRTSKDLIGIGKSEKYFFLYNKLEKTTWVIKVEDVDELLVIQRK